MLNPELKAAVRVPDATMDAMRMPLRFFATARAGGAELLNLHRGDGPARPRRAVQRRGVHDHVTGRTARSAPTSS